MNYLEYFPKGKDPRDGQVEMLEKIAFSKKRVIIIQAPTGAGKSYVAACASRAAGTGYILTATKPLQDQYLRDFKQELWYADLRGRANYRCLLSYLQTHNLVKEIWTENEDGDDVLSLLIKKEGKKITLSDLERAPIAESKDCKSGPCSVGLDSYKYLKECRLGIPCSYYAALEKALTRDVTTLNFIASLIYLNFHKSFKDKSGRDVIIIDEAHDLESQLVNFAKVTIRNGPLRNLKIIAPGEVIPDYSNTSKYYEWLVTIQDKAVIQRKACEDAITNFEEPPLTEAQIEDLDILIGKLERTLREMEGCLGDFVFSKKYREPEDDDDIREVSEIEIKPLEIKAFFEEYIGRHGSKIILLSATLPDPDYFAASLGITKDDYDFVDIPSDFPPENRPIILDCVGEFTFKNKEAVFPKIKTKVAEILQRHPNVKGIIHCQSYVNGNALADYLISKGFSDRVVVQRTSEEAKEALEEHTESGLPTVLISPTIAQGSDFRDNLSRFQIMIKVPYPNLQDAWVKAKSERDPNWYINATKTVILQQYGRSIRSNTDHAVTYLLDSKFWSLLGKKCTGMPRFFTDAIKNKEMLDGP